MMAHLSDIDLLDIHTHEMESSHIDDCEFCRRKLVLIAEGDLLLFTLSEPAEHDRWSELEQQLSGSAITVRSNKFPRRPARAALLIVISFAVPLTFQIVKNTERPISAQAGPYSTTVESVPEWIVSALIEEVGREHFERQHELAPGTGRASKALTFEQRPTPETQSTRQVTLKILEEV